MSPYELFLVGKLNTHYQRRNVSWYARMLTRVAVAELRVYRSTRYRSLRP